MVSPRANAARTTAPQPGASVHTRYLAAVGLPSGGITINPPASCSSVCSTQLKTIRDELERGIGSLLGTTSTAGVEGKLSVSFASDAVGDAARGAELGDEGFAITSAASAVNITARTPSGAMYGVFKLLSFMQQRQPLPERLVSSPKTKLRHWDLWDGLDGSVTRGFAGRSLLWPVQTL